MNSFNIIFSWVLATTSLYVTFIQGNKDHRGWLYGFINTALWIVYSVLTEQWAFIPLNVIMSVVQIRNYLKWRDQL